MTSARLITGNALERLAELPDGSVDAVVTDPPYELDFMRKAWDRSGIAFSVELWRQVLRVLKPGGHLLAFGGTRTHHRMAVAIEDAGFELRDELAWLYASGFPKSRNLGEGRGTALKPAHEPVTLARAPLAAKSITANVAELGTGGLNVDACRVGDEVLAAAVPGKSNLFERSARPTEERVGCWPPNLVLSHAPDCGEACVEGCPVLALDAQVGERTAGGSLGGSKTGGAGGIWSTGSGSPCGPDHPDAGPVSRFFPVFRFEASDFAPFLYVAKPGRSEREFGCDELPLRSAKKLNEGGIQARRDDAAAQAIASAEVASQGLDARGRTLVREDGTKTLVDRFIPQHRANTHPTVKPVALMAWLCRLITPRGGVVLDPFAGSGTTGMAALREGFSFIGVELDPAHVEIARARIDGDVRGGLFERVAKEPAKPATQQGGLF